MGIVMNFFSVFNFNGDAKRCGDNNANTDSGMASAGEGSQSRRSQLEGCRRRLMMDMS